jgi:glutamyl-Q tRNA(Asp) synthetase
VRGADLLGSTARQALLQRALGYPTPRYLHFPVALDAAGEKLSKQTRAAPVDARDAPALIARALRFLGQEAVEADTPRRMLDQARAQWDVARIPRAGLRPAAA